METSVENPGVAHTGGPRGLALRLLGPVSFSRDGQPVVLPRSRKVRALLAYLALEGRPVLRSRLCDLLWDVPNDPRGELRWCLSKLRGVLDDSGGRHGTERRRVLAIEDAIALDLSDVHVDARELERAVASGLAEQNTAVLSELSQWLGGELLEGITVDGNLELSGWLAARRAHYRQLSLALLGELVARAEPGSEQRLLHLRSWLTLAPFDPRGHEQLLATLVQAGRVAEAEAHVAAVLRGFEHEGLDWAPLRSAWHALRAAHAAPEAAVVQPVAPLVQPVAPVVQPVAQVVATAGAAPPAEPRARRRASIAVMPFTEAAAPAASNTRLADGLTEDIITRLAKLRVLFVIARGTVFALGQRGIGAQEAGRILNVEYVASGTLRRDGARVSLLVELAETEGARIIWADELSVRADETFAALDAIVDRIVAALAEEIESAECQRALLRPPSSLDAWQAYHRGLWHMYRFNGPDNLDAERFFRTALASDPTFSRAHAGLSFTHFQNAFLSLTPDRERQVELALSTAAESLAADDRDPAAHWALGRALWLSREHETSLIELQRCVELSPNFALGYYTLGFVQSQAGDPRSAIIAIDTARQLSPFDPLLFGMLASRAVAHLRLGEIEEAAQWSAKAAVRPNAHDHILAIAACCAGLANRRAAARELVARVRARAPGYGVADLLRSFRFDEVAEQLFRRAARQVGFGE